MVFTPSPLLLKLLYDRGSLHNLPDGQGVAFRIKNRLDSVQLTGIEQVQLNDTPVFPAAISLLPAGGPPRPATTLATEALDLPVGESLTFELRTAPLPAGLHRLAVSFSTDAFGELSVEVEDALAGEAADGRPRIPRSATDDYAPEPIQARQQLAEAAAGQPLAHLPHYAFDPHVLRGNIEQFVGVAQVPIGLAGPLLVHGEHAQGEFLIPLATTEGTLVASYNRGMQALNLSGGVKCTVLADAMQRAPVFVFDDARGARDFARWVEEAMPAIRAEAESTSRVAKLQHIETYLAGKLAFLRFNYFTGDAAGQNMVGRATLAACSWMLAQYPGAPIRKFYLESNFATDKKPSQVNTLHTRGKRVVAEATLKREVLRQRLRVTPEQLAYHGQVGTLGAFMSGANNNGAHSANGITALFIATGQDVANVAESSAGILYSEVTPEGDLYVSMTLPSLIVATHGGGTGLPTQQECLRILGCVGDGTVLKLAEVVAAVVLAGELSLGAAISSSDWVSSHEQYGRNR